MNLPLNGRIILIDDNYHEIEPILDLLSRNRIPYNYYSVDPSKLPLEPINAVRIIFLDLELSQGAKPKDAISIISSVLKRIILKNPSPYIIVVWSKHATENDYTKELEKVFHKDGKLENIAPVKIIYISKSNYMNYSDEKWILDIDGEKRLKEDLPIKLENQSILINFINYENIVHQATSELINDISSDGSNKNWSKDTKTIINHLAKAVLGKDELEKASAQVKIKNAFMFSNRILQDRIKDDIKKGSLGKVSGISNQGISTELKVKLNTKIHLSNILEKSQIFEQGNLFIDKRKNKVAKLIIDQKIVNKSKVNNTSYTVDQNIPRIFKSRPWQIMLDVTPACDYSQNKNYTRILYGVLIKEEFYSIIKNAGFLYSQKVIFNIDGENRFCVFDFRRLKTFSKKEFGALKIKPKFRLNQEFLLDVQAQLSNQINRPGISTIS